MYWMNYVPEFEIIAEVVFGAYLVWVAWQDYRTMQVVRFSHGLGAAAILMLSYVNWQRLWTNCGIYMATAFLLAGIQFGMHRMKAYGFADVIVLFMCGVYWLVQRGVAECLVAYALLMSLSVVLLWGAAYRKGNVHGTALKRPMPYIPYICCAFFLTKGVL